MSVCESVCVHAEEQAHTVPECRVSFILYIIAFSCVTLQPKNIIRLCAEIQPTSRGDDSTLNDREEEEEEEEEGEKQLLSNTHIRPADVRKFKASTHIFREGKMF